MAMFTYLMVVSPTDDQIKLGRCLKSLENQGASSADFLIVKNGPIPQILEEKLSKLARSIPQGTHLFQVNISIGGTHVFTSQLHNL